MRRGVWLMLFILLPTANLVHADSHPFNFYFDEEIVIHPAETVSFRIAWQNIADDERHFLIETKKEWSVPLRGSTASILDSLDISRH